MSLKGDPRSWYHHPVHVARRDELRRRKPLCEDCLDQGKLTPMVHAHHVEPHLGDINKFLTGELRAVCRACHARAEAEAKRGYSMRIGLDGRPLDPMHPVNVAERERAPLPPLPSEHHATPTAAPPVEPEREPVVRMRVGLDGRPLEPSPRARASTAPASQVKPTQHPDRVTWAFLQRARAREL
jgi:5-methylcytosine-specific restriction enzyme A